MAVCKVEGCGRRVTARGWCSTHYRWWRQGKPMDRPVRTYQRYEEGPDGSCVIAAIRPRRRLGREPFAKELSLLQELGLRKGG